MYGRRVILAKDAQSNVLTGLKIKHCIGFVRA